MPRGGTEVAGAELNGGIDLGRQMVKPRGLSAQHGWDHAMRSAGGQVDQSVHPSVHPTSTKHWVCSLREK
jgi:hypothetical protein